MINKKLTGAIYTPSWVVNLILDKLDYKKDIENKKIIDPASGNGAFLTCITQRFVESASKKNFNKSQIKKLLESNIFGWDTDQDALKMCQANLNKVAEKYGIKGIKWNLKQIDSLNKTFCSKYFEKFDFVVGNPPYIRIQNLAKHKRNYIQKEWEFCSRGSTDIYIAFFELGYKLLKNNGLLGFITPNTYLKTSAAKTLRSFLKNNKIIKIIIDFSHYQIFKDATTYSIISIFEKNKTDGFFSLYKGNSQREIKFVDKIHINNLNDRNWIFQSNKILQQIRQMEAQGIAVGKIAKIHVGITTLADSYYIFENPVFENNCAYIKLKYGQVHKIEREILKPIIKASILKDYKDIQNRYIIFPYKKIENKHQIIPEKELEQKFPLTLKYFKKIKHILDKRDRGKPNKVKWYAFGRSQGIDSSFGNKIITSPMNLKPNFIVWERPEFTFYSGYCIKYAGNNKKLAEELNSKRFEFYINNISRNYRGNYKSYAKSFIENYGISNIENKT